jgi:tetratricopeptide (TPR) repeat protein
MNVQDIDALLALSRPKRRLLGSSSLILLGLSMVLGALWTEPAVITNHPLGWLLPQAVLVVMIVLVARNAAKQRRLSRVLTAALEAVQLRQWPNAREGLTELLHHRIQHLVARGEAFLALAATEEADHHYDIAQRIYQALLQENDADLVQLHIARVCLAATMLRTGQVTDAVKMIERLERVELPDPLKAQVELLCLFREVTMGQAQAGIERADQRRQLFRQYLGTRAAYGYGLLAAAFDRVNRPDQARAFWQDATLLLKPAMLLERFDELKGVAAKYPAAEYAL